MVNPAAGSAPAELAVRYHGQVIALRGHRPAPGQEAPPARWLAPDRRPVRLEDFAGRWRVLNVIPTFHQDNWRAQTLDIARQVTEWRSDAQVLSISSDLPFAVWRWQREAKADGQVWLSAGETSDFAWAYGLVADGLRLLEGHVLFMDPAMATGYRGEDRPRLVLGRAVFVVNPEGRLTYAEYVPELTDPPRSDLLRSALEGP